MAGCMIYSLLQLPFPRLQAQQTFSTAQLSSDVQGSPGSGPWAWPQIPSF